MSKEISAEEVSKHSTPESLWVIIEGNVYDVTEFQNKHPGGKKILARHAGTDATKFFRKYHDVNKVLKTVAPKFKIGSLAANPTAADIPASAVVPNNTVAPLGQQLAQYGDMIPFGDPTWYQGYHTLYYNETHVALRDEVRKWVEEEIEPYVDEWDEAEEMPNSVYKKFAEKGYLAALVGLKKYPTEYTSNRLKTVPLDKFDAFHEFVILDELCRAGSGGIVWNLTGGFTIGSPPIFKYCQDAVKKRVLPQILSGDKRICLAITEPEAGSDVANLTTTATKSADGKHYIVNGSKKWITNGLWADFFTVAVRTGGPGMAGISMLLIEKTFPGVEVRKIHTQGMRVSGSSFITFDDVKVPVENLIGQENKGFKTIVTNFNHERLGIIGQAVRFSRVLYEEATKYAHVRETFGQKLIKHDVIRQKLANMAAKTEAGQAWLESMIHQCRDMDDEEAMMRLGGAIAGLKAFSTINLEFCAREASQVFGGLSYTRGGRGAKVERLYREVRAYAIPGGSEEIMLDLSMRQSLKVHEFLGAKL